MRKIRLLAVGMLVAGAAALSTGIASAANVQPLSDGVQVDLSHEDTLMAHQFGVGSMVSAVPNASVSSFGATLGALTELASKYPQGRVVFTVFGPLDQLRGTMVALER